MKFIEKHKDLMLASQQLEGREGREGREGQKLVINPRNKA